MSGRIQHHTDPAGVAVLGLVRGDGSAEGEHRFDGGAEVGYLDLEVHHLLLGVGGLGPCRRLVPGLGLDVDSHSPIGIPQLDPPVVVGGRHVPPEQSAVEGGELIGIGAVDADTGPSSVTTVPHRLIIAPVGRPRAYFPLNSVYLSERDTKHLRPTPRRGKAMTDPTTVTLVKNAVHNPNEPRHFMRIVPAPGRRVATAAGHVLADSDQAVVVKEVGLDIYDPVVYFPRADVDMDSLAAIDKTTHCPLKGDTEYFDLLVGGDRVPEAAWSYVKMVAGEELFELVAFDPSKVAITADDPTG